MFWYLQAIYELLREDRYGCAKCGSSDHVHRNGWWPHTRRERNTHLLALLTCGDQLLLCT